MKTTRIFIINGGMTFKNQKDYLNYLKKSNIKIEKKIKWSDKYLEKSLGSKFEIIKPRMPLQDNAKYKEWEIWFKHFIPFVQKNSLLIGSSLGGIFLAKFLSENKLPKKVLSTYLICPPFDDTCPSEDLVGGFKLKKDLSLIEKNTKNLYLLFSKDDDVVPISHAEKYRKKLPTAILKIYESKNGHFKISKFPEIIKMIKADVKKN